MTDKLKNEAAERIYLQLCDDSMSEWCGEVTWCEDRVHDEDVEYVRADVVERLRAELAGMKHVAESWHEKWLANSRELAAIKGQEPVAWPNRCDHTIVAALQYLSRFQRPEGGNDLFNAEHLEQLADELQRMANRPLYTLPVAPVANKDAELPLNTTPAIREALRTGSRKDYPSDELCEVRWAAIRAAMAKGEKK